MEIELWESPKANRRTPPTLAELEENERECRTLLEFSAEHYAYAIDLPANIDDEEECDRAEGEVEEAIEYCNNLVADGEEWLDAYRALRDARAKTKQKVAA
jgi:hypothetical protein